MKKALPYLIGAAGILAVMAFMPKIKEKVLGFLDGFGKK